MELQKTEKNVSRPGSAMTVNSSTPTDSSPSLDDLSDLLSFSDVEEMRQVQTAFSNMIDQTCSSDSAAKANIFEHTYMPHESFGFLFRSIIPTQETLHQKLEQDLPENFFKYEDNQGIKYAFKVLDRRTNRLTYEQMPTYHRYAMRLLFRGPVQRELLHTNAMKKFFNRETLRLGKAFDEPKSRKHIAAFVKMYQIDLEELLQPNVSRYFTFNEFFYRKLKPSVRPIENADDPCAIVSAADCRLILFDNICESKRIWIKGQHFSLRSLFDDEKLAEEFEGGSIAVFRLAPVDYHRFHSPISGRVGDQVKQIPGTYYTVNPIAIKENLDVLTMNQRTVMTIESDCFERIVFVAIGALLVGSVNLTVKKQQTIVKGDELGYFAYGGSTVVVVFKPGMIKWDDDLRHNSHNSMETLVRMGEHIGQRMSNDERQENALRNDKTAVKNPTIAQLLSPLPVLSHVN